MMKNLRQRVSDFLEADRNKAIQPKDRLRYQIAGIFLLILLASFFYRSLWAIPFLSPFYFLYCNESKKLLEKKYRKEITLQFKDAILSLAVSMKAGYSVENAFRQAYGDMLILYGKESRICQEFYRIIVGMGNNLVLEGMLQELGKRSGAEDIQEFAEVFAAAKRNGGNLTEMMEKTAAIISEKVETEKEIEVLLSARRMEQQIMNIVPFGILLYINMTSAGYFDVLYHNIAGVLIMTVCLGAYLAAIMISMKIVNIEV